MRLALLCALCCACASRQKAPTAEELDFHRRALVVDAHSDVTEAIRYEQYDLGRRHEDHHEDLPRMQEALQQKLDELKAKGIHPKFFYTITGFHGLHVIGGLIAISFLIWKSATRSFTAKSHAMLESVSFYWHFVDVVWLGVFTALYLTTRGGA